MQAVLEWEEKEHERQQATGADGVDRERERGLEAAETAGFVAYVPLPDQKEIEARVLEKKKADLLAKYVTPELQDQQQQAKSLLNINR